ncbi:conserved hypothetical protein [Oleispira antarctica RB-8]|uniref:Uncharacterized protein n=1 Tax=Oleispira antarctica RB-8 TaxID=698738 RepID=R4YU03_OLEAN|nr:conserved hypothetical protein [Oleispira antarctica RB-8]
MLRFSVLFLALMATYWTAQAEQSVYSSLDVVATSEPVPIEDMTNGWDGNYRSGELAFADASFILGFSSDINIAEQNLGTIRIERELRAYYYMSFDKETADFYRALELGNDLDSNKKLDLKVKQFDVVGLSAGYTTPEFSIEDIKFQLGFDLAIYQVRHFQFGSIKGIAEFGSVGAASAVIDYRYDEDKILDHQADVDQGRGMSFSADLLVNYQQWQGALRLKDMANRFQWDNGAYTRGCVNIGGGAQAQCETDGSGSGTYGQEEIIEHIPLTANARLMHLGADVSVHVMRHDLYYRLGLEKGFQTELGRFALFLYHPRLVGASWQTDYFNFQFGADTLKLSKARNIQLNMGVNWRW